jgi:OHCU decarboxylase
MSGSAELRDPLVHFNALSEEDAASELLSCCGAKRWAREMALARPYASAAELYATADRIWATMIEPDWLEAIACHPRIGERKPAHASAKSQQWSSQEQSQTQAADASILAALAEGNNAYEKKFGITYIVCATGKSAGEMLAILQRRLSSTRETELTEAAAQQQLITRIRLEKWLQP